MNRLVCAESSHQVWTKVGDALHVNKSGGLKAIQLAQEDGSLSTVSDPKVMTPLLVKASRKHYMQADGTPFTTEPLADISYTACCVMCEEVLKGCSSFSTDDRLSSAVQEWIRHAKSLGAD